MFIIIIIIIITIILLLFSPVGSKGNRFHYWKYVPIFSRGLRKNGSGGAKNGPWPFHEESAPPHELNHFVDGTHCGQGVAIQAPRSQKSTGFSPKHTRDNSVQSLFRHFSWEISPALGVQHGHLQFALEKLQ